MHAAARALIFRFVGQFVFAEPEKRVAALLEPDKAILEEICAAEVISAAGLPKPSEAETKARKPEATYPAGGLRPWVLCTR